MTVSLTGDGIFLVALAWQVYGLSDSPASLAGVGIAMTGAHVLFLLAGGVVSDRVDRRRIMVGADAIRCVAVAVLGVLSVTGALELWHVTAIAAVYGAGMAFFGPAFDAIVPELVPEEMLQGANSLDQFVRPAAVGLLGPALGGWIISAWGSGGAFLVDAATFLVSAAFLVRLRPRRRGEPADRTTVLAELREGWAEVRSRTWIWVIVAAFSLGLLTAFGPWMTLGPTISQETYDTAAVYGILASAMGAGTIAGALVGFRWRPRYPMRMGMLLALPLPISLGCFGLGLPVGVLLPVFVLAGMGIALFDIWWHTALAERVPPHMLSRVTAYDWMGSLALLPIGYVLAGPLGEALGAVEVLTVGCALALAALAGALLFRDVRSLRRLEPVA
jgi:MFS family permease